MSNRFLSVETSVTRVTQQHVDARRDAILRSAARLFARKGISGATMQEIANEADLSAGAIYRYYSSKEELLHAVFEEATTRNEKLFHGTAEKAASPLDALREVGQRVWVEQDNRDELICDIQMILAAARAPQDLGVDLLQTRYAVRDLLEELVRYAQAAGQIDPDIDSRHLAVILQACTAGIQMLKLNPDDDLNVQAAFDLFVKMVSGLGPRADERNEGVS